MRLVIDAVGNRCGGGAVVLLNLLEAIAAFDRINEVTLLASPEALREFTIPRCGKLRIMDVPVAESIIGRFLWAMRGLDDYLNKMKFDAFLGLNGIGSVRGNPASFVFIQQPVPYSRETLQRFSLKMRLRMAIIYWVTRRSARRAAHTLVQSEVMRETVSRSFDIHPARISAFMPNAPILLPPTENSTKLKSLRSDSINGTLLYVGSASPHKNLSVVAQGLRRIPESKRPKWYVTLPEDWMFCRQGLAISLDTLTRKELHEAYRVATVLVMSSLTETVGLPMLEAMRAGIPVLAADRPYAHEVCEDAAVYFDPLSPDDFAEKLEHLIADTELKKVLIKRGQALIKRRDSIDSYRNMLEKIIEVTEGDFEIK